MRNIAAYLLAVLGGNANPDAAAINKILASVGINGDAEKIEKLIAELKGKDIHQVIAEGQSKLSTVSFGSGPAAPTTSAPAAEEKKGAAPAKEEKKKEEPKEQSDEEMGFGLFD